MRPALLAIAFLIASVAIAMDDVSGNPDALTGAMRFFESLDLVGALTIAASILWMAVRLGRKVGSVETGLDTFARRNHEDARRNHEDHERIVQTLDRGAEVMREHDIRIGRLEGEGRRHE